MNNISHDNHPECGENEYFVRNVKKSEFWSLDYKTKRAGKIAYDRYGNVTNKKFNLVPVFLDKELEGQYYNNRPYNQPVAV